MCPHTHKLHDSMHLYRCATAFCSSMRVVFVLCLLLCGDPEHIAGDCKTTIKSRIGQACGAEGCVCISASTHAKGNPSIDCTNITFYLLCGLDNWREQHKACQHCFYCSVICSVQNINIYFRAYRKITQSLLKILFVTQIFLSFIRKYFNRQEKNCTSCLFHCLLYFGNLAFSIHQIFSNHLILSYQACCH